MKINGIQCVEYDPELLAHNIDYSAFETDWTDYNLEDEKDRKAALQYEESVKRFNYTQKLIGAAKRF